MTPQEMERGIVRYGDLRPCKTAFIDAHTPGSDQKENFTIIGPGVSENPDQHVHIAEPHGFNIGGARQPPGCVLRRCAASASTVLPSGVMSTEVMRPSEPKPCATVSDCTSPS